MNNLSKEIINIINIYYSNLDYIIDLILKNKNNLNKDIVNKYFKYLYNNPSIISYMGKKINFKNLLAYPVYIVNQEDHITCEFFRYTLNSQYLKLKYNYNNYLIVNENGTLQFYCI